MQLKRIIVEANIPFVGDVFSGLADVRFLPPEEITPETMQWADALITRTRTRCDAHLLAQSPCSIIATATIGTDHIDLPYCQSRRIAVRNAPGCNAPAVAQYVFASAISTLQRPLNGLTIGVVGIGYVGSIVAHWAEQLGMRVLACDPPRANRPASAPPLPASHYFPKRFASLADVAREADVVSFHTPLTSSGDHPSFHLASEEFFSQLQRRPLLVNSARGPVVDTAALIRAIEEGRVAHAAIDCWEGEPHISPRLLELAEIATPHIAGYSLEGKKRATAMAVNAVMEHFGFGRRMVFADHVDRVGDVAMSVPAGPAVVVSEQAIARSYDPLADTRRLKADPSSFESLRNHYPLRGEVPSA